MLENDYESNEHVDLLIRPIKCIFVILIGVIGSSCVEMITVTPTC